MTVEDILPRNHPIRLASSMDNWWPRLKDVDVPTPATERIEIRSWEEAAAASSHMGVPDTSEYEHEVRQAVREVGGYPAFVRTDQASGKHRMEACSKLTEKGESTRDTIFELFNHNEMLVLVGLPFKSLYVREWLDLASEFTAFRGTPIAPEVRWFILDGKPVQHGFYWPKDAIAGKADEDSWESAYRRVKDDAAADEQFHRSLASAVGDVFEEGYWSVDFALAEDGTWYCIDMARGERSFHPEGCEKLRDVADFEEGIEHE